VYWDGTNLPKILSGNATAITPGIVGFNIDWVIEAPDYNISYGPVPNWFDSEARCLSALVNGCWPDPVQANWLLPAEKEITFKQRTPSNQTSLSKSKAKQIKGKPMDRMDKGHKDPDRQFTQVTYNLLDPDHPEWFVYDAELLNDWFWNKFIDEL